MIQISIQYVIMNLYAPNVRAFNFTRKIPSDLKERQGFQLLWQDRSPTHTPQKIKEETSIKLHCRSNGHVLQNMWKNTHSFHQCMELSLEYVIY
jgi:hypothetical protein